MTKEEEYLIAKGHTISAIVCKDDNLSQGKIDFISYLKEYADQQTEELRKEVEELKATIELLIDKPHLAAYVKNKHHSSNKT